MPLRTNDLSIYKPILNILNEPVLFVSANEKILFGNQAALFLLQIDDVTGQYIRTFLDFEQIKHSQYVHKVLGLHTNPDQILSVKSLKVHDQLYCLGLSQLSLQERSSAVRAYVNANKSFNQGGMVLHDETRIMDADDTFLDLFGYSLQEVKSMTLSDLIKNRYLKNELDRMLDRDNGNNQLIGCHKDDTTFYADVNSETYLTHEDGSRIQVSQVKDNSLQVENEQQIDYMAYYDDLTGLPNGKLFVQTLRETIKEAEVNSEELAVYFIDLDYFKEINDTLGYAFGNKLLQVCSDRLKTFLGDKRFLSRLGGDEFLILERNCSSESEVTQFAQRLIQAFEEPIIIRGYELSVSLSIGISSYPSDGNTANKLIKHADSAMYVIKGNNKYNLFDASISEDFKTMLTMENELRRALKQDQLKLYYQPQKCLKSDKVIGIEALLRWEHPVKGLIPPGEFIPLAEKTGLIIDIGDWVIGEACRQNKAWQKDGYDPVIVSVNLSAKQFHQKNLVHKVEQVLTQTGLKAEHLELEITESMAMSNEKNILDTMNRMRNLGVHVSIDDFGTGYSSLKYLSTFPVTKLKIDKSFISEPQSQNKAIVKSIINMSHALKMKVIAEGVETLDQLSFLKNESCDEMQGFYFSKPLPPAELTGLFNR